MAPRSASGDGLVAVPPDGQFQSCRPWRSEALKTGVRDPPRRGPNNEEPATRASTNLWSHAAMPEGGQMFVGWDWASTTHDLTVLDDAGAVVDRWALRHTEQDLAAALDRLAGLSEPTALPVIIERTSGLVVERLLAAGHPVVPVHPTAFWAARPRWGASGPSPTLATATSSPMTCAPTGTGSAGWIAPTRAPGAPGPGAAARGPPAGPHGGSQPARRPAGADWPGPKAVFYRLASPIALAFLAEYPTPRPPPGSARPAWLAFAAGTATAAASHPRRCWPGCARPRPPRSASRRPPWRPLSAPSPTAAHPAGDHR
jgi:Transposase